MDSSQNWLGFSLSHRPHHDASNLCLYEAFHSNHGRVEDDVGGADLTMLDVGPKLEDFLGGGSASVARFSGGGLAPAEHEPVGGYDSDLKSIAAGFLRGYGADPLPEVEKSVVPSEVKKAVDTFGQRTSIYRGVTRHRWTGRYEAHLWDNSCRREGQSRKGRQVYLGGYDKEEKAARAYDLAALKYWGPTTTTNFPISDYEKELEEMKNMTRQEFVASLRRKSSGFSRGASIYRGVTRHHQHGRWQARIGRVAGNKDLYLGTFSTQEEAAEAYDVAAIKFRGLNAVTNFDMSRYDVKSIMSSNLPIGGVAGKTNKTSESSSDSRSTADSKQVMEEYSSLPPPQPAAALSFALPLKQEPQHDYWSLLALHSQSQAAAEAAKCNAMFPSSSGAASSYHTPSTFNMNFYAGPSAINQSNISADYNLNGDVDIHQQHLHHHRQQQEQRKNQSPSSSSVPFANPNPASSSYDGGASYGSWAAAPSIHAYQAAKPNLAVLQTPIFGME